MKQHNLAVFIVAIIFAQNSFALALRLTGPSSIANGQKTSNSFHIGESECGLFSFSNLKKCISYFKKNFNMDNYQVSMKDVLKKVNVTCSNSTQSSYETNHKKCEKMKKIVNYLLTQKVNDNSIIVIKSISLGKKNNLKSFIPNKASNPTFADMKIELLLCLKIAILTICFIIFYFLTKSKISSCLTEKFFNSLEVKCDYETINEAMNDEKIRYFLFEKDEAYYKKKHGKKFLLSDYDSILIMNELFNILNADIDSLSKSKIEFSIELFAMIIEMKKSQMKEKMETKVSLLYGFAFILSASLLFFYSK